jgi:hypothetical protein
MSYDVAVWVGERPATHAAAAEEFDARADASEGDDQPPGRRIRAYADALVARFPEGSDAGVWAVEPVLDVAGGDFLSLNLIPGDGLDDVVGHAGELAQRHGLVAYDPQRECLLEGSIRR